mgnify:FL=1
MDLETIQNEIGQCAESNFGQQPPSYPLVGAIEEMGELSEAYLNQYEDSQIGIDQHVFLMLCLQAEVGKIAHSILKRTQGIREDDPDVGIEPQRESIAVARMILKDLDDVVEEPHDGREVNLDAVPEPGEELIDSVADTQIYLGDFSHRAGIDMADSLESTWLNIVSDRDWDSDLGDA